MSRRGSKVKAEGYRFPGYPSQVWHRFGGSLGEQDDDSWLVGNDGDGDDDDDDDDDEDDEDAGDSIFRGTGARQQR